MISLKEISNVLGETSYCLRDVCCSTNLNKWSLYKPVTFEKKSPLTTEDFDSINYGFVDYEPITTFNRGLRNSLWNYSPITAPYRLSDFKNYNHYYKFIDFINDGDTNINIGGSVRCSFTGDIIYMFEHFDAFKDARTSSTPVYLCILLMGNYPNESIRYIYRESEIRLYDYDDIRFYTTGVAEGTYTVVPVLTNNTQVNNMADGDLHVFQNQQGQYWMLPAYCEYNITVTNQSSDFFDEVYFELDNVWFDYDNYFLTNFAVTSEIVNHGSREYSITMNINYNNTIQGTVTLGSHSCSLDTINTSHTKRITNSNIYETVTDAQLYDGIISVTINASIRSGNTTQTKQWQQILEKN